MMWVDDDCTELPPAADSHIVVHLWRERDSSEIRARLQSPQLDESIIAIGTAAVQRSVISVIEHVCKRL